LAPESPTPIRDLEPEIGGLAGRAVCGRWTFVEVQPAGQRGGPFPWRPEGMGIGVFAHDPMEESFGLAVGAQKAWCASALRWRWRRRGGSPGCGRHLPLSVMIRSMATPVARKPGARPLEEAMAPALCSSGSAPGSQGRRWWSARSGALWRLGVSRHRRQRAGIPSDAAMTVDAKPATGNAVPDADGPAALPGVDVDLGVDVDQLAGALALAAHDRAGEARRSRRRRMPPPASPLRTVRSLTPKSAATRAAGRL
jgi:hypothetical protein